MMSGKCHHAERLSMFAVGRHIGYNELGIEVSWSPLKIHAGHARVALQDDFCTTLAHLSSHITAELIKRNLPLTHGLPRRASLLLSPDHAQGFIDQVKADYEVWERIQGMDFEGKSAMCSRSVWNLVPVKQLVGLLKTEDWKLTPRLLLCIFLVARLGPLSSGLFCRPPPTRRLILLCLSPRFLTEGSQA